MQLTQVPNNEAAILARVIQPDNDDLPLSAARVLLKLDFTADDRQRMHDLALKNQAGKLKPAEQQELDGYIRVGRLLDLLGAKARRSLKNRGHNA